MADSNEAKQLDSVTDRIAEKDAVEEHKAKDAMAALKSTGDDSRTKVLDSIQVDQKDVDVIVDELEVTEDVARGVLKDVIFEGLVKEGTSALEEALRRLLIGS
jgi:polyhydroxyalkanoate synthesis regulator protein